MFQICEIVTEIKKWLGDIERSDTYQKCKFEYLINTPKALRLIIVFPNCIGEIVVNEADCAPYRFVKFEAVAYVSNAPCMITYWYDEDGDTKEHVILGLENAFKVAVAF